MAKCANCDRLGSIIDEQKSKIQLLETRLREVVRAYKVVLKEKDDLMNINASITADVDCSQQKRIADLEENVIHLSVICGKHELERKRDKEQIDRLENECDSLRKQLPTDVQLITTTASKDLVTVNKPKNLRNKSCQTDAPIEARSLELVDKCTQTNKEEESRVPDEWSRTQSLRTKQDTAVVAPLQRHSPAESETDELSDEDLADATHRVRLTEYAASLAESASVAMSSGVSLFYVNELARKELELAETRLRVRECECSLREMQWKYSNEKYRLQSRIADLELLNGNFMATKSDHTAPISTVNVAYIKNVLTKLLDTKDKEQKQIMISALLTALNSIQT